MSSLFEKCTMIKILVLIDFFLLASCSKNVAFHFLFFWIFFSVKAEIRSSRFFLNKPDNFFLSTKTHCQFFKIKAIFSFNVTVTAFTICP